MSELSERATRLFNKPDAEWDAEDCAELDRVLDEIARLEEERNLLRQVVLGQCNAYRTMPKGGDDE